MRKAVPHTTTLRRAPVQRRSAPNGRAVSLDACPELPDEAGHEDLHTLAVAVHAPVRARPSPVLRLRRRRRLTQDVEGRGRRTP